MICLPLIPFPYLGFPVIEAVSGWGWSGPSVLGFVIVIGFWPGIWLLFGHVVKNVWKRSKMTKNRLAVARMKWVAALLLAPPAMAGAETALEFHLCGPYVHKSIVGEQTRFGWPVIVMLTEPGAASFEEFTEAGIGRKSRIVVDGREFSRATIWAPILGGKLQETFSTQEVATAWQRTLAGKLPAAPCGNTKTRKHG